MASEKKKERNGRDGGHVPCLLLLCPHFVVCVLINKRSAPSANRRENEERSGFGFFDSLSVRANAKNWGGNEWLDEEEEELEGINMYWEWVVNDWLGKRRYVNVTAKRKKDMQKKISPSNAIFNF